MNALKQLKIGLFSIGLLVTAAMWAPTADAGKKIEANTKEKSDLNEDGLVDLLDLSIFSRNYLQRNPETVSWCLFYQVTIAGESFEGQSTAYYLKHFKLLLSFMHDFFDCGDTDGPGPDPETDPTPPLLKLENRPKTAIRAAEAKDGSGNFYFTDFKVGSLHIYDAGMNLKYEIKDLSKPLGVGVNDLGQIFIGNDGRANIEVYDPKDGNLVAIFGEGQVRMPTAISFDLDGNIYVTDSGNHHVAVFDPTYRLIRTIGSAGEGPTELNFPVDTEVVTWNDGGTIEQEVLVADQGNMRIQAYDIEGNHLREITMLPMPIPEGVRCGWFNPDPRCLPPEFKKLQALSVDAQGRVHALDLFSAKVYVLDPADGNVFGTYGEGGTGPGLLKLPMDVIVSSNGQAIVTAGDGARIEVLETP